MPELIDHVGYLERSVAAIRLPISVKRIPNGWKITGQHEICRRRNDDDARECYVALRRRLLDEVQPSEQEAEK